MATVRRLMIHMGFSSRGFESGVGRVSRSMEGLHRDVNGRLHDMQGRFVSEGEASGRGFGVGLSRGGGRGLSLFGGLIGGLIGRLGALVKPAASAGLAIATIGSTALAAAPLLAPAAVALFEIGQAAVAVAPALLALGAAGLIVKGSLMAIFKEGSAARKALTPLADGFNKAAEAGSRAAAHGVRPLAEQLRKAAFPVVRGYMIGVGQAANRVQRDFLNWARSSDGIRTLRGILEPISAAMQRLAPHVSKAVIAFARMLGRIMGVSVALGSRGLAGALDWLTRKMNAVNAITVTDGLAKLKGAASTAGKVIRTVAGWIGKLVAAYRLYTTQFKLVADAMSVVAIIFGGPIIAAIGVAGLIIRHFDQVKAAWERLKAGFAGGSPIAGSLQKVLVSLQQMKTAVVPILGQLKILFLQVWTAVRPALLSLGTTLRDEVLPAVAGFVSAVSPIVQRFLQIIGPHVAATFANLINIVRGALQIVSGIIKVVTGLIKGDWGMVWDGVKLIFRGAWNVILAIGRQALNALSGIFKLSWTIVKGVFGALGRLMWSLMRGAWNLAVSAVKSGINSVAGWMRGLPGRIRGAAGNLGHLLYNAGKAVLMGLWNGISSMSGKIARWIGDLVRRIIPGPVRKVLGIHSPSRVFMGLGVQIGRGLALGMDSTHGMIARSAGAMASAALPSLAAPGVPTMGTPAGLARTGGAGRGADALSARAIGDAVAEAFRRSGLKVDMDGRQVAEVVSKHIGRDTNQRRRTG